MRVLREPLLHFAVLGALVWALTVYLQAHPRRPTVTLTRDRVAQLADHYRQQYGSSPTPAQLDGLVDTYLIEELKYRAALQLGLDKSDEIVRRRLVQKYEFLQQDLGIPAAPSDAQLREFYDRHLKRYQQPPRVTFTHVYFAPDRRGDAGAREAAAQLALTLNQRGVARAPDRGDRYPGPSDFVSLSEAELGRVFGEEGLSHDVFSQPVGRWSPPLRSGYGWHTVYVVAQLAGGQAAFEQVRERVIADYEDAARTLRNAEDLRKLREQFHVVRE